jgi:two-component system nitrate/nitrite response regulator NarL
MRLLVCDAQRLLLDALSMALMQSGYTVVATALDPDEAVAAARDHQPDACLLNVDFLRANELDTIARIHAVSARTKVVKLARSVEGGLLADAIAQGAAGFTGKEEPVGCIVEALGMAFPGHLPVDPRMLQEILRLHEPGDRRDMGRPDRREAGRSDRRDVVRPVNAT